MKIIEVLVIEQEKGLFQEIARGLPLNQVESFRYPAFRLEIDTELIIYFYVIDSSVIPATDFLEDIFPHIKRMLILGVESAFRKWNFSEQLVQLLEQHYEIIPTVLVLVVEAEKHVQRSEVIFNSGLYLGNKSRLMNREQGNKEQVSRIWDILWNPVNLEP